MLLHKFLPAILAFNSIVFGKSISIIVGVHDYSLFERFIGFDADFEFLSVGVRINKTKLPETPGCCELPETPGMPSVTNGQGDPFVPGGINAPVISKNPGGNFFSRLL